MVDGWETVDKLFYKLLNNEILPSLRIHSRCMIMKKSKPKILKYFPEEFKMWILRNNAYCLWNPDLHILILSILILNLSFINKKSFKQMLWNTLCSCCGTKLAASVLAERSPICFLDLWASLDAIRASVRNNLRHSLGIVNASTSFLFFLGEWWTAGHPLTFLNSQGLRGMQAVLLFILFIFDFHLDMYAHILVLIIFGNIWIT